MAKILNNKKSLGKDLITLAVIIIAYAIVAFLLYSGNMKRQMTNMLVPISVYICLAVSLNLVVGLLGELSLGHAGFMSVGLFSGCLPPICRKTFAGLRAGPDEEKNTRMRT